MKKLTETMKQMLDALACAHAGEHLSAREKARILAPKSDTVKTDSTFNRLLFSIQFL